MIEKAVNNATEFTTTFNFYLEGEQGGDHVDVINGANEFAQSLSDVLTNVKGIARLTQNDEASDKLVAAAKTAGDVGLRFFLNLQSYKLDLLQPKAWKDVPLRVPMDSRGALSKLSESVESVVAKRDKARDLVRANGDIRDNVEQEMLSAVRTIEAATQKLQELMAKPKDTRYSAVEVQVHESILQAALGITNAIGRLIRAATASQQEIVAHGKGSSTTQQFYKRNNRWTEGLISAAKAVALATTWLIRAADGVLGGTHTLEQLVAASRVKASLMSRTQEQLELATKASLMSRTQEQLELATKACTAACKVLVRQVKATSAKQAEDHMPDYADLGAHEFKVRQMEQQVEILRLEKEKELNTARRSLGQMRATGYHEEDA